MCKRFLGYCMLYAPCRGMPETMVFVVFKLKNHQVFWHTHIICVYFMLNFGLIFILLWKCMSMVSSFYLCVVFVLLLLHLPACFISLWLIPYPTVDITNLGIHGLVDWLIDWLIDCVRARASVFVVRVWVFLWHVYLIMSGSTVFVDVIGKWRCNNIWALVFE
jgi:hypothetical protein